MKYLLFAVAVGGVILFLFLRSRLRRRHQSLEDAAGTPISEECHQQCIALLQEALESGDHRAMSKATDKTTKDTLPFIPLRREYPQTDLEVECFDLFKRVASIVHGERPTES